MKITDTQQELIQKYLSNTLSQKDQALFESEKKNADFKKELLAQTEMLHSIELSNDDALRAKLKGLDVSSPKTEEPKVVELNKETSQVSKPKLGWLKYAVLLGILLVGGFLIKQNIGSKTQAFDNDRLFAEYYKILPVESRQRGTTGEKDPQLVKAMDLYRAKKYEDFLASLEANKFSQAFDKTTQGEVDLYHASASFELGDYLTAKTLFKNVLNSEDNTQKELAEWGLTMLYLKLDDKDALKNSLDHIIQNPPHLHFEEAKSLRSEIK